MQKIGAGHKVAALVAYDTCFSSPISVRHATDASKHPTCGHLLLLTGLVISQGYGTQKVIPFERGNFGVGENLDVRAARMRSRRYVERVFFNDSPRMTTVTNLA